MPHINVTDLFPTVGKPTATYVKRENGRYEQLLSAGLAAGALCLITGPSKTGKTTLYSSVLSAMGLAALIVRSDLKLEPAQIWRKALEQLDFERLKESQFRNEKDLSLSGKISGQLGWKWLAGLSGEASTGVKRGTSEAQVREKILAEPSPSHLATVLTRLKTVLVLEDFHYLSNETKMAVFQQWKTFVDERVAVIVIGTTHHAVDLATANKELVGRIYHIEVGSWSNDDLTKIAQQGFDHIKAAMPPAVLEIPRQSVGLPIITQQALTQVFHNKGIHDIRVPSSELYFSVEDVYRALHDVAHLNYGTLEAYYGNLKAGSRNSKRKYETFECVLACFSADPVAFALERHEIEHRIGSLSIAEDRRPPQASITSTLRSLEKFQRDRNIGLLEWREDEGTLYVLEPAFLFYIRWRSITPTTALLERLADNIVSVLFGIATPRVHVSSMFQLSHRRAKR